MTSSEVRDDIKKIVYEFLADECEVEIDTITDTTNVIDDLEGDSLLYIEMLQLIKKKYNLNVSMQAVGKYMLQNRAETVGRVIDLMIYVIENQDTLV
ncbi:MAG: acyl carrier protein [Fibrobacterota bacterium]|nr:phosphopantetheine-binding protein [Chitinispirillaceae bacterium]